jgi:(p)ppGpp synthase/HD superfamily hydrolase
MTKIRQWFNKQTRAENIERGRQMLDKELRRLGITTERQVLAGLFSYPTLDDSPRSAAAALLLWCAQAGGQEKQRNR